MSLASFLCKNHPLAATLAVPDLCCGGTGFDRAEKTKNRNPNQLNI